MIKYIYLLTAGLLVFCTGRAQIKKGQALLGCSIQFSNHNSTYPTPDYSKGNTTIVAPSVGWAIKDNLEFGGRLLYSHSKEDQYINFQGTTPPYIYRNYYESNNYGLAVYIRRYTDLGHGFAFYAEGGLAGMGGRRKLENDTVPGLYIDQKMWSVTASFTGGMVYRVASRWMLEAGFASLVSAGYTYFSDKGEDANSNVNPSKSNTIAMGTTLSRPLSSFTVGCRYIL